MSEVKGKSGSLSLDLKKTEEKQQQKYYYDSYGNVYVDHAVAGMQPSGHRYREGGIIYYYDSSGRRVDGSSIPAMCVDNCLKNANPKEDKSHGDLRYVYLHDGIEVVTRADGVIITVTRKDY